MGEKTVEKVKATMRRITFICLVLAGLLAAPADINARVVRKFKSSCQGALTVRVDSIDYRRDLTRVYARLLGWPHTSQRIDAASLDALRGTDIDGVDFKRYFQWEDDGTIIIEIDFAPLKPLKRHLLKLQTVKGPSVTTIIR